MGDMSDQGQGAPGPAPTPTAAARKAGGEAVPQADPARPETLPQPTPPTTPSQKTMPLPGEVGGPSCPEPTRYGDWERKGRVSDF